MQTKKQKPFSSCRVWLLVAICALVANLATHADVIKLSGTMPDFGDVKDFQISPDGQYVVYRADQDTDDAIQLYGVPTAGGTPIRLSGLLPTGSNVADDYQISADSSRVVYRAPQEAADVDELYSVPLAGPASAGVKLNAALTINGDVLRFRVSPDSSRVVYLADQASDSVNELYSVPLAGPDSAGIKLNGALVTDGDVLSDFVVSPDGARVVYRADQQTDDVVELYSVPLAGPASAGVKLNGSLVAEGDVLSDLLVSPDSARVIYRADQQTDDVVELYSVPLAGPGSAGVKLNGPLVAEGDVGPKFLISADSGRVVYGADQEIDEVTELYSVPIVGPASAGVKLNGTPVPGGQLMSGFLISADSSRVVYRADLQTDDSFELYSVPLAGPAFARVKLNQDLAPGGNVIAGFLISADSSRVIYRADQETDNIFDLYSVPLAGPASAGVRLNPRLARGGNVRPGFVIAPGSERVLYRADQQLDTLIELYSVPLAGTASTGVKLNDPLVAGGMVQAQVALNPGGDRAVYRAEQDAQEVIELYAADVQSLVSFRVPAALAHEDALTATLPVQLLNAPATLTATVEYAVTGGTATGGGIDYTLDDGLITFAPGQVEQVIEVLIVDDGLEESPETVILTLSNPQNAELGPNQSLELLIADEILAVYLPLVAR